MLQQLLMMFGHPCSRRDVVPAEKGNLSWTLTFCTSLDLSCNATTLAREPCNNSLHKGEVDLLASSLSESGRNIRALKLRGNWLGPRGGKILSKAVGGHPSLVTLDLESCRLGDVGIAALSRELVKNPPPLLEKIVLSHNSMSDMGVKEFAAMLVDDMVPKLVEADLSWNGVTPRGSRWLGAALGTNTVLQILVLNWNGLMDRGAKTIGEALGSNSALRILSLEHNAIKNEGARALAQGLRLNGALKELSLEENSISDDVLLDISSALKALPHEAKVAEDGRRSNDDNGEHLLFTEGCTGTSFEVFGASMPSFVSSLHLS